MDLFIKSKSSENICKKCGAILDADSAFCFECGSKVDLPAAPEEPPAHPIPLMADEPAAGVKDNQKKCQKCGTEIDADSNFCWNCGYVLESLLNRCSKCNAILADGCDSCIVCGTSVAVKKPKSEAVPTISTVPIISPTSSAPAFNSITTGKPADRVKEIKVEDSESAVIANAAEEKKVPEHTAVFEEKKTPEPVIHSSMAGTAGFTEEQLNAAKRNFHKPPTL